MKLADTLAVLFGFKSRIEVESDAAFSQAVNAQNNGTDKLADARAKLEACRNRIHSRVARIEAKTSEAVKHDRVSIAG